MLRGILQSYWESLSKNAERCYRRSANTRFAKILRGVLQKYKEVFCKNIESCSANLLRGVLRSYPPLSLFVTIFGNPLPPVTSFFNDPIRESTDEIMFSIFSWFTLKRQQICQNYLKQKVNKTVSTIIFVLSDGNISQQEMLNYFMNANAQEMTKEFLHNFQENSFYSPHYCVYCMDFVSIIHIIYCTCWMNFFSELIIFYMPFM